MALMSLRKKQDGDLTIKYDSFTGLITFFFNGEEIAKRTIERCEEIFPQYTWHQVKEETNKYITFIL